MISVYVSGERLVIIWGAQSKPRPQTVKLISRDSHVVFKV